MISDMPGSIRCIRSLSKYPWGLSDATITERLTDIAIITLCYLQPITEIHAKRIAVKYLTVFTLKFKANNTNIITTMWNRIRGDSQKADTRKAEGAFDTYLQGQDVVQTDPSASPELDPSLELPSPNILLLEVVPAETSALSILDSLVLKFGIVGELWTIGIWRKRSEKIGYDLLDV